jgi:hypothetical protein
MRNIAKKIREMVEPRCYFSSDYFYLAEFLDQNKITLRNGGKQCNQIR